MAGAPRLGAAGGASPRGRAATGAAGAEPEERRPLKEMRESGWERAERSAGGQETSAFGAGPGPAAAPGAGKEQDCSLRARGAEWAQPQHLPAPGQSGEMGDPPGAFMGGPAPG